MKKVVFAICSLLSIALTSCGATNNKNSSTFISSNNSNVSSIDSLSNNISSSKTSNRISKKQFPEFKLKECKIEYDGREHINSVYYDAPEGTTQTIIVKNEANQQVHSVIEIGTYYYSIHVSHPDYYDATFNVTLLITTPKKVTPLFSSSDGNIYFSNYLDEGFLYSIDSSNNIKRLDYSSPKKINKYTNNEFTYVSSSLFNSSVKRIKGNSVETLYSSGSISDFVKLNENTFFYSSNTLSNEKSGIYKVDVSDQNNEPIVTKVFSGKTSNLSIYNGYLYFINQNSDGSLFKLDLYSYKTQLVINKRMHEYLIEDNVMYCAFDGTLNDYIGFIDLTIKEPSIKVITSMAGEYLSIKDGYLYFNNCDLLRFVDKNSIGIYRVDLKNYEVQKINSIENISSLTAESNNSILYINADNLHLYRYYINSKTTVDLLEGFVKEETTPLNTGGKSASYVSDNGDAYFYFLNMYAGKTLYRYKQGSTIVEQVTTDKVEDFVINNGTLYFNQVTYLVNNDIYSVNLKSNEKAYKICDADIRNMVIHGDYIYGTHYNFLGVSDGITRMKLDGSDYNTFSNIGGAKNFVIKDDKLLFVNCATGQDNGNIEYINLEQINNTSKDLKSSNLCSDIKNVKQFAIESNNLIYIYNGTIENSIRKVNYESLNSGVQIASKNTNPSEFIISGSNIYYYSFAITAASKAGFYKVSIDSKADQTYELIKGYENKYYATSLLIVEVNYLFFLNYIPKLFLGDAHIYKLNLLSQRVDRID